ncbi:hypothetical protein NMG60_11002338 [Bertholletia excelsa]
MANLPPIRVRVEEQTVGLDEQFSRVNMNNIAPSTSVLQKQDDGSGVLLSAPLPPLPVYIGAVAVNSGEQASRIFSDDERSDQGAPSGFRKPPLPLQAGQRKVCDGYNLPSPDSKHAGGLSVQSPDSVASDNSIASANSLSKHMVYQEATQAGPLENRASSGPMDPKGNCSSDPRSQVQVHHDPAYLLPPQQIHQQQHQFVNSGMHYNYVYHHPATGQAPASSYYQMYPPPPAQQPLHHQPVDNQQYPIINGGGLYEASRDFQSYGWRFLCGLSGQYGANSASDPSGFGCDTDAPPYSDSAPARCGSPGYAS